jgi:hypothetical protein
MSVPNESPDFGARLATAFRLLARAGVPFIATPAAIRLEHDLVPFLHDDTPDAHKGVIVHLEGDRLRGIAVPTPLRDRTRTPVRYFLDGVQRTLPLGWCGMNALACVVIVAGIIERRPQDGVFRAVPGMTQQFQRVIIASTPGDPYTQALFDAFRAADVDVTGTNEQHESALRTGDFLALQNAVRLRVSTIRDECELAVFTTWTKRAAQSESWLLVDGSLMDGTVRNTLGMIKRHSQFTLTNEEMMTVLHLPVGHRSTAYQREATGRARPKTWYLRLHEPFGADPLFGLARIEAPAETDVTAIDTLSQRILTERTPRATNDDRWPTLLYPIHIAERILKVKLERALLGVPAAMRRHLREVA